MADIGHRRVLEHPLLGPTTSTTIATVTVDGRGLSGIAGEPIAALLIAHGILQNRTTPHSDAPRGYFCGVGRCADCAMTVDGELNVRACMTPVREGMVINTQQGLGTWETGK